MDVLLLAYPVYLLVLYVRVLVAQLSGRARASRVQAQLAYATRRLVEPRLRRPAPLFAHSVMKDWPPRHARKAAGARLASRAA